MNETLPGRRRWRCPAMVVVLMATLCVGVSAAELTEEEERQELIDRLVTGTGFLDPIAAEPVLNQPGVFGQCIDWGEAAYVLPASMTAPEVQTFMDMLPPQRDRRYRPHTAFWARTATNGPVTVPGQRITLTWSIVPDGTSIFNIVGTTQPSILHSEMNAVFPSEDAWKDQFRRAFDEFGDLIGVNYVEVSDDGASQGAHGQLGARGDVRISMIDMGFGPLAFNYFPIPASQLGSAFAGIGGDMVFNSFFISDFGNASGQHRLLRNVIMHEHGHGIGYRHVDPLNRTKLMEAILATNFDGPQEDDIRGFQSGYGDRLEVNTTPQTATVLEELPLDSEGPLVFENLALESAVARDYFRINVPELTILTVVAEPVGTRYQEGPQGGVVSWIEGNKILDIVVDLLDGTGTQVLHSVDLTGLGEAEILEFPLLAGAGEYLFRVRTKGSLNQSQRYRLQVSRREGVESAFYAALAPIVDDSAGNSSGAPDPGEANIEVTIPLRNMGFSFGPPFTATLVSDSPTVTITQPTASYGSAAPTEDTFPDVPFRFNVSPEHECGDPVVLRLIMALEEDDQESPIELATGILGLGDLRVYSDSFPDPASTGYTNISVQMVNESFEVGRIRISNINLSDAKLENHSLLLLAPSEEGVVLSNGNFKGSRLEGTTIDNDGLPIFTGQSPYTGTFRPVNSLSALHGVDSEGAWRFVAINTLGDRVVLIDSWQLELAPMFDEPFCAPPIIIAPGDIVDSILVY